MKLRYLGTAAYEGVPAIFCECEVCKKSRELGGINIKTRSQAIVDDHILIDFPADTYIHSILYGIDLTSIQTCIVTHKHSDHFYPEDLPARTPGYGKVNENTLLTIYGSKPTIDALKVVADNYNLKLGKYIDGKEIKPFISFMAEGYKITPLKADHAQNSGPVFYIIEKDGKALLYAHDTGYFPDETWKYLKKLNITFDLVSLDCTGSILANYRKNHMGLDACQEVKERLISMTLCKENTRFILNHFSHNGKGTHEDICIAAEPLGFEVAFDGMTVKF